MQWFPRAARSERGLAARGAVGLGGSPQGAKSRSHRIDVCRGQGPLLALQCSDCAECGGLGLGEVHVAAIGIGHQLGESRAVFVAARLDSPAGRPRL